ncbi:DUF5659 domain-containing protein [Thermosediminibacter oceani]|uniref:DUF5659 domain-containing protein n=1 Tax=Thermosediminibacter oceani (strain ATCC BAA-1034 / DSM 16646 / JW/IW-1228P) TaxID=555079 RepID=D9S3R9_THEOJ|nr:DUF5659 domain-containing protein [Thermosediminibacter oceani]ADL08046.1 hypothetical protein Toce_1291 [Thermosediminibacter oceani DSM 16646]
MKPTKVILNPALARKLVKKGFKIVDLKPHKQNHFATVFVFENSPELQKVLEMYENL